MTDQPKTQDWRYGRAAFYGLLPALVVLVVQILGEWAETRSPYPMLTIEMMRTGAASPAEFIGYWAGYFTPGPLLFVLIAAIRNLYRRFAGPPKASPWKPSP